MEDVALAPRHEGLVVGETPRGIFRSAVVYASGAALPRAVALLTLPIYARVLTAAEYGTVALLTSISTAVSIGFALGLDVALFRLYFHIASPRERRRFLNSAWTLLIVVPTVAAVIIAVCSTVVVRTSRFSHLELLLALMAGAMSVASLTVPLTVLRAEQRLGAFILVSGCSTLLTAALSLGAVVGLEWGIAGWLGAGAVAGAATLLVSMIVVPFDQPKPLDRAGLKRAIGFGLPLVPHSFAHWALQAIDRVIIAGIVAPAALGVYSLASSFGLPVLLLVQSLNYAAMPSYARAGANRLSRRRLSDIVVVQVACVILIGVAGALLAPPFVALVTPEPYASGAGLIPWIALGYTFLGLYYIPMNGLSLGGGRTRFAAVTSLCAAAVNVALLYALVPSGGIRAAAIAAAAAYGVLLIAVFVYGRRSENPVEYRWRYISAIAAAGLGTYALARLVTPGIGGSLSLLIRTSCVVALAGLLLVGWRTLTVRR
jgi:O-antigen/teichoic acid export membrane protein